MKTRLTDAELAMATVAVHNLLGDYPTQNISPEDEQEGRLLIAATLDKLVAQLKQRRPKRKHDGEEATLELPQRTLKQADADNSQP